MKSEFRINASRPIRDYLKDFLGNILKFLFLWYEDKILKNLTPKLAQLIITFKILRIFNN